MLRSFHRDGMEYPARRQSLESNPIRRECPFADIRVGWIVAWLILGTMAVLFLNDLRGIEATWKMFDSQWRRIGTFTFDLATRLGK